MTMPQVNSKQAIDQLSENERAGKEPSKIGLVRYDDHPTSAANYVMKFYAQYDIDLNAVYRCGVGVNELENLIEKIGESVQRLSDYFNVQGKIPEHLKGTDNVLVGVAGPPGSKMQFATSHWYLMTEADFGVLERRIARHNAKLDLQQ